MLRLTDTQKRIFLILAGLFAIDNIITTYGAFFYGPGFYEANPMFHYFLEMSPLILLGAITYLKIAALAALVTFAHFCNTWQDSRGNGQAWGTLLCGYATCGMGSALAVLTYINLA